jgi:hypothetical protein
MRREGGIGQHGTLFTLKRDDTIPAAGYFQRGPMINA